MEEEHCDGGHKRDELSNSVGKVPECGEKKPIQHQGLYNKEKANLKASRGAEGRRGVEADLLQESRWTKEVVC